MSRLRVCFVVESGVDVRLIEGLDAIFDLTILARRIPGGVEISHPPAAPVKLLVGPASRISFARFVARYLRRERASVDAVLVQGYSLAALAANLIGKTLDLSTTMLVCSPTELYYLCRRANPQAGKPFRWHELRILRFVAAINARVGQRYVVLSQHLASVVAEHGGRLPIQIIPVYGVDTSVYRPATRSKADLKSTLGLPTTGTALFFSSRIAPEKDSETLLSAVREVVERGYDIWILHRSGGYQSFLTDAQRFGIAGRVSAGDALHPIRDLPGAYQAADLCVQASREEGLGFSPLEALACQVPVIATAVGGLRETIVDGETGWTYAVGDVAALRDAIVEVIERPGEAARRAAEGRRRVEASFSSADAFARLQALLTESLKKPS